ncbi:hypothetical protein DFA_09821 [Cavenderia fasciculata]|uniref:Uncharacterized protein n=1 Tax=Cavenderia fasciculata TaxID=261658 RepID=F4QAU2_CACFS|nr:uncharacterized protein DFA_09821 [Cavenderia fasciculata]EGG15001.1 hypothetical protein DFA_09821 [Cavenderia fasciculata]|eukprot:XP_004351721.1 hypothetical protein DFA_09821 [Cavenderia fasciculata]
MNRKIALLLVITVAVQSQNANKAFVKITYMSTNCTNGSESYSHYTIIGECVRGSIYNYDESSQEVVAQPYRFADCTGDKFRPYTYSLNKCLEVGGTQPDQGYMVSVGTGYSIPDNSYVWVGYTSGQCNDWKDSVVELRYRLLGACQPTSSGSSKFDCNTTTLSDYGYPSYDFHCSGTADKPWTVPFESLNYCGTNGINEYNFCVKEN